MTDYIIKNGPDLPDGVDAGEFEREDGRIVCEYRQVCLNEQYLLMSKVRSWPSLVESQGVYPVLIRKPAQPPAWPVPAVLQGEEWRGFSVVKRCTVVGISSGRVESPVIIGDEQTPFGQYLKLTTDDFCGMQHAKHYLLGPQPKPAWKCTGKLAGSGAYLTYCSKYKWELWTTCPARTLTGYWDSDGNGRIAVSGIGDWTWFAKLIGPLPDVDGIPVEERMWKL